METITLSKDNLLFEEQTNLNQDSFDYNKKYWIARYNFKSGTEQEQYKIKGCPLGRGKDKDIALRDYIRRIIFESNVLVSFK